MKLKKRLLVCLLIVLLFSFPLVFYFEQNEIEFQIFISLFSSSLLSVVISIIEYVDEKTRAESQYNELIIRYIGLIKQVKYFNENKYGCPVELILECLEERRRNEFFSKYNVDLKNDAKFKMYQFFETNKSNLKFRPSNDENTPENFYNYILEIFVRDIRLSVDKYKLVCDVNEAEFINSFESLCFIFFDKRKKSRIEREINKPLLELIKSVKENYVRIMTFDGVKNDCNDVLYCVRKINYDLFFTKTNSIRDRCDQEIKYISVYCKTNIILENMKKIRWVHFFGGSDDLLYGVDHYFEKLS